MSLERTPLDKLPEIATWMAGWQPGVDSLDFLGQNVSIAKAVALLRLYWPEFVEDRGGVFVSSGYSRRGLDEWMVELEGDMPRIEHVMNHVHLWDVFAAELPDDGTGVVYGPALKELGQLLAESWRAALRLAFPDRSFVVEYSDDPSDYGPTVSFWSSTDPTR
ncbi:hypothetical protein [Schumannella luteola]